MKQCTHIHSITRRDGKNYEKRCAVNEVSTIFLRDFCSFHRKKRECCNLLQTHFVVRLKFKLLSLRCCRQRSLRVENEMQSLTE